MTRSGLLAPSLVLASAILGGTASADDPRFEDPAPPVVNEPAPMTPPSPAAFAELVVHATPRPLAAGAVTEDWPCFLGPRHDGHSRETGLERDWSTHPPRLLWSMERGRGYSCPVVQGRYVVYPHRVGGDVHVDCLDAETGRRYWRHSYPCAYRGQYVKDHGMRSTPVIDGDRVYVHGVGGMLHCLDLATGRVVWKRNLSAEFGIPDNFFGVVASPIIHGDHLIQVLGATGGPTVAAFDKRTGRLIWGTGTKWSAACSSPVVADIGGRLRLFALTGGESRPATGGLMVMDPGTGALEFEHPFRSRTFESVNGATPIIGGDRVFLTASYNTGTAGFAIDKDGSFEPLWKNRHIGLQFSTPLYVDGHLYAIDGRSDRVGAVICLDPATGAELSRTDLAWEETVYYHGSDTSVDMSVGEGSMLYVDGHGLCLGDNGHLLWLKLSPAGATVVARTSLFRANESWSPPALSRGLLYVVQNNRERFGREPAPARLLCFDLRATVDTDKEGSP